VSGLATPRARYLLPVGNLTRDQCVGMAKKPRNGEPRYRKGELWIAPSLSLKQPQSQSDWKLSRVEPPLGSNKFLELADVALGLSTTEKHKKKRTA
jgi:hypothetical protein